MSLVKGKNIDTSKVSFSAPKLLENIGAKLVYVNYNGGRFSVQTPWMSMPWKMGSFTEEKYPKYNIDLSFKGMDENPEMQGFHDKLKDLEQKIIDGGFENKVSWLRLDPKKTTREVVESKFSPLIKESKDKETGEPDGKWPPSMKLKVPRRDGTWEFSVKNSEGKVYNINDMENPDECEDIFVKNTKIRAIIQCVGLWIGSGNYMCQWKLTKAEVSVPTTYSNDDFLESSDDESNEPEANFIESDGDDGDGDDDAANGKDVDDGNGDGDGAEDGDDAEDGGSDHEPPREPTPEPEPEPAPAKKKRVIKKKKVVKASN